MAFDPLSLGVTVLGGLLGGSGNQASTTQSNKMDPRLDRYVYGPDSESGLLGSAFQLMQQQMGQGGLNDLQRQGLEMQRQYLMSPQYSAGMNRLQNLGMGLLGAGVAGNPFTGGGVTRPGEGGFSYSAPMSAQLPSFAMTPMLTQPKPVVQAPAPAYTSGGYSGGYGSGLSGANQYFGTPDYDGEGFAGVGTSGYAWGPYSGGGDYSGYTTGSDTNFGTGGYSYGGFGDGNSGMGDGY